MRRATLVRTVDDRWMILVNGVQWGGERDASGAGNATFETVEAARGVWSDCGNLEELEEEERARDRWEADEDDEDDGRWEGGYRHYRDGSYREDFRSDC